MTTQVSEEELVRAIQELNTFAGFIPAIPSTQGSEASTTAPPADAATDSSMPVDNSQKRKEEQENQVAAQQRTKWPKGPGKGQGYNQDRKPKQQQWWGDSRNQGSSHSSDDLKNIVRAMGRLLIRQEDSLSILQQDTQLIVFLKNREQSKPASEDWSIVQALFLVGKHWREQKEKSPNQVTQPLRVVLLGSMLDAILNRVKQLETDPKLREVAEKRGLVVNGSFPFLQWDPEKKEYQASSQAPLSFKEVQDSLAGLKMLIVHPQVVARFHALRKLTAEMTSEIVPFTLEIQNRSQESQQAFFLLGKLSRNSCTHLVSATLRPAKLGRSPLANTVDRLLQDL